MSVYQHKYVEFQILDSNNLSFLLTLLVFCSYRGEYTVFLIPIICIFAQIFSRESDSRIANVRLSVCLSVRLSQKPLSLSELLLSSIKPICHWAYQPSSQSTIEPINHRAYQLSSLLTSGLLSQLLSLSAC